MHHQSAFADPHQAAIEADMAAAGAAPELQPLVAAEQLRMIISYMTVGTVVATGFALVLAFYATSEAPLDIVVLWVAIKVLIALPRIVHAQIFRLRGGANHRGWQWSTSALLMLDGACWGAAGVWVAHHAHPEFVAVMAASLSCVAAVATFGLQVRLHATACYAAPMLGPMALTLIGRGDRLGAFAGVGLLMLLALLLATARRSEKRIAEVFRLRFLMSRVARQRAEGLEQAKHQNVVKSRFLAAMSHEFRTPLHGILGLTRVLRADIVDPHHKHRLGLIQHSGEHLLRLINDLLDLSRIEAGRIDINPVAFDLSVVVEELVQIYLVRAREKGLELLTCIEIKRNSWVHGDATRLQQVLHNLLGNAIKFTDIGFVQLAAYQRELDVVEFSVADSGQGISNEDVPHIFSAFSKAASRVKRASGTGLGLHISREIVEAMGGTIHCISELGKGSRFTVRIPLHCVDDTAGPHVDSSWAAGDFTRLPERVLLAEDNEVNAIVVQAMLARSGCGVEHALDGEDAVRRAMTAPRPDVILMDCQMANLDGLEATRAIRRLERQTGLRQVPVVALTANTAPEEILQCREAGMDHFVAKPFTEKELFAAIAACTETNVRISRDPGHRFQTIPDTVSEQAGQRFRLNPDGVSA